jgi:hypothetical protein
VDVDIDVSSEELPVGELWKVRWRHAVRRYHEEHVEHRLRDTATTGTALGNTGLDLIFTRNISVECLNDISHFSYHRPVLNRVARRLSGLPLPNQEDRV